MAENGKFILIYATYPTLMAAETAAAALIDAGLAACANLFPGMVSIYTWEGRRQREQECAMLVKTRSELGGAVVSALRRSHPYDNPALIELPISGGSEAFLTWISAQAFASATDETK